MKRNQDVPRILVIDGDATVRRALRRVLSSYAAVDEAASAEAAGAVKAVSSYAAVILEATLPGGLGLDWLASARKSGFRASALVVASLCEPALVNRAYDLDARYLCKPVVPASVRAFAALAVARHQGAWFASAALDPFAECVDRLGWRQALTAAESAALGAALQGPGVASEVAAAKGMTRNTAKTLVRRALRKLGASTLEDVRRQVLLFGLSGPRLPLDS